MTQSRQHSACGAEQGLISVDQALATIQQHCQPLASIQRPLAEALQHYLAAPVYSAVDLPLFSQSAVDGYALHSETNIEAGSCFEVLGEVRAGQKQQLQLHAGQAMRIFTGAQLPGGTSTVARQEIVKQIEATETPHNGLEAATLQRIQVLEALDLHRDIRDQAEEVQSGQCLAEKDQRLSVGAIAALSMAGISEVKIYPQAKIAVVITGDEVAQSPQGLSQGQIFDANGPMISAWFKAHHQAMDLFYCADTRAALEQCLAQLSPHYQLILSTGGVSVGDYDLVRPVALDLGFQQLFWKVLQKPGKPMFFAQRLNANASPCYLLGLPGNPAAVFVGLQIYLATVLRALQGQSTPLQWFNAILEQAISADRRERFLRMSSSIEHGQLTVKALAQQQSHMLSNLIQSDCLVRIPADVTLEKGDLVYGIFL